MRLTQLDGLRGLAALIVVVHHTFLLYPALARSMTPSGLTEGLVSKVLVYSPLHLIWDGPAAVSVFFVLSGFVLTLPFLSGRQSWRTYYAPRLVRLYLPTGASVVLALAWVFIVPRHDAPSWWLAAHTAPWQGEIVHDLTLVRGTGPLNSPLWSLRWEVWFSLLLPLYLVIAVRARRLWPLVALGALALSAWGVANGNPEATYLPTFLLGALLAVNRDQVARLVSLVPQLVWVVIGLACLNAPWWPVRVQHASVFVSVGAALLVAALLVPGPLTSLLQGKTFGWLGRISFSLYLVHEPMVVSLGMLGLTNPLIATPIAVPAALVLAAVFFRLVERPSHRLAKSLAGRLGGR